MREDYEKDAIIQEEKHRRMVVALTVGAVLLLVILLSIMVYQIISIFVYKKQLAEYEDLIAYYNQLTEEEKKKTEACELEEYIKLEARKLGLRESTDLD